MSRCSVLFLKCWFMMSDVKARCSYTSSAWENWLKRFRDSHRIRHFHVAMIKGIIYNNLASWFMLYLLSLPLGNDEFKKFHKISSATFLMHSLLRYWMLSIVKQRMCCSFYRNLPIAKFTPTVHLGITTTLLHSMVHAVFK